MVWPKIGQIHLNPPSRPEEIARILGLFSEFTILNKKLRHKQSARNKSLSCSWGNLEKMSKILLGRL